MDRFQKISAYLLIVLTIAVAFQLPTVLGPAAPGRNTTITPGMTQQCTYTFYKDGSNYLAWKGQGGDNFDAGSTTFSTEAQAVFNTMPNAATVCFEPGDTFAMTVATNFPAAISQVTVLAYGATIQWTGGNLGSNTGMFANAASSRVDWYGGTIDQNGATNVFAVGWGSCAGSFVFPVTSSNIYDVNIINVIGDGLLMCNSSNKNIYISNVLISKSASGTTADLAEVDGTNIWALMYLDPDFLQASGLTASGIQNATLWAYIRRASNGNGVADIGLQSFTGNIAIQNIDIYTNGAVVLNNGNFASGVLAGHDIRIHGFASTFLEVGTNGGSASSGGEVWKKITVEGTWILKHPIQLYSYNGLLMNNMIIDAAGLTGACCNGVVYLTSTNAQDRLNDNFVANDIVFSNATSTDNNYFWASNTGNNKVANATFTAGSIRGTSNSLSAAKYVSTGIGTTYLSVTDVGGVNGFGTIVSKNDITGQTAASSNVCTYTTLTTTTILIGGYIAVTAVSGGAVSFTVTYTDENSNVHSLEAMMLQRAGTTFNSATTINFFQVLSGSYRVNAGTTITTQNGFGATATYDSGCWMQVMSATG